MEQAEDDNPKFLAGINEAHILRLSKYIREAWNDYFWNFRFCQDKIRFTAEERTNYVGDLFNYFDDIIHLLSSFKMNDNYQSALYDAIAALQSMYAQQDLMDELLLIFVSQDSGIESKNPVRQLRNELIGHPISRKKNKNKELISSVFITGQTKGSILEYIRYHKDNGYKHEIKRYNWRDIFQSHENFLKTYFNLILEKIDEIIIAFKKELQEILEKSAETSFEELVLWIDKVFEYFHTGDYLFKKDSILYCYLRQEIHPRYRHVVNMYKEGLKARLEDEIQNIDTFLNRNKDVAQRESELTISVTMDNTSLRNKEIRRKSIHYEFGKLYEKHAVFGIDYFITTYQSDFEIMLELENMREHGDNNAEYYSSYEYLRILFKKRGLLD